MGVKFHDGFDHYRQSSNSACIKWDGYFSDRGSWYEVQPGRGRPSLSDSNTGGLYCESGNGYGAGTAPTIYLYKNANANLGTGIVQFAFKYVPRGGSVQGAGFIQFQDGTQPQCTIGVTSAGQIYVTTGWAGGTVIATSVNALSQSVWYSIEIKATIHNTTGSVTVRVNGTSTGWINLTGANTRGGTTNAYFTRVACGQMDEHNGNSYFPGNYFIDDFIFMDTTGTRLNDFIGDRRVNGRVVNGNGSTLQFTRTFASWPTATAVPLGKRIKDSNNNIQEVTAISGTGTTGGSAPTWDPDPGDTTIDNAGANQVTWTNRGAEADWLAVSETIPDSDSSYIADGTVGDVSLFTSPSIAGSSVDAMSVYMFACKDDAGSRSIRGVVKHGATVYDNGTDLPLGATYQFQSSLFETNPGTGSPWTVADLNAAEIGVKVTV